MFHRTNGFYLLEIIFGLCFSLGSTCWTYQYLQARIEKNHALSTLHRIEQLLSIARHSALTSGQAIFVCSSNDLLHCQPGHWQDGLLMLRDKQIILTQHFKKVGYLQLSCFGKKSHQLKIEPDGTTYQNGHFYYLLNKNKPIKLVFNRFFRFRIES